MYTQKLYKNGNSIAVTIPKEVLRDLNIRESSQVVVEYYPYSQIIIIAPKRKKHILKSITPEFYQWVESFCKEHRTVLEELARK